MFGLFDKAEVNFHLPDRVLMEETIECVIDIAAKSDAKLRKIEVELFCKETAITRGTSSHYSYNTAYNDLRIPVGETYLRQGESFQLRETFQLPAFTTPTMKGSNHMVEWFVRLRLDVPWWPDTRAEREFVVLPCIVTPEVEEVW